MSKTILMTGATDGIGQLAAKLLVKDGHKVLLHGRSAEKLAATAALTTRASLRWRTLCCQAAWMRGLL